jgi:hypothetical protein
VEEEILSGALIDEAEAAIIQLPNSALRHGPSPYAVAGTAAQRHMLPVAGIA